MNDLSDGHESLRSLASFFTRLSGFVADALRYWELRRFVYHGVLACVVAIDFVLAWPISRDKVSFDLFLGLFTLGVVANIAFCTVYAIDLFIQLSGLQAAKRWSRPAVLIVGTAFASTITHFVAQASSASHRAAGAKVVATLGPMDDAIALTDASGDFVVFEQAAFTR